MKLPDGWREALDILCDSAVPFGDSCFRSVELTWAYPDDVISGEGTRLKLCFNLLGGGMVAALAESMALLDAVDIDPQLAIRILQETNLPSRMVLGRANLIAQRDFAPRFSLDNMAKDLQLALDLGRANGLSLIQTEASRASLQRAAAIVGGDRDLAASFEGARQKK